MLPLRHSLHSEASVKLLASLELQSSQQRLLVCPSKSHATSQASNLICYCVAGTFRSSTGLYLLSLCPDGGLREVTRLFCSSSHCAIRSLFSPHPEHFSREQIHKQRQRIAGQVGCGCWLDLKWVYQVTTTTSQPGMLLRWYFCHSALLPF